MSSQVISVAIIEDHALVREGLIAILSGEKRIKVVGEAANGRSGLKLLETISPDIVLLDLILPTMHGFEVLRRVKKQVKAIALSMRADDIFVAEAIRSGASGYLTKEATSSELVQAIDTVAKGKRYLGKVLNQTGINRLLKQWGSETAQPHESLTTREHAILQLSADGFTSGQIADQLGISPRTVEMHRANLMRKLGLITQTDLVRFAIRNSIIHA